MSKSHYSYPPDEFDVRGPEGTPVGVHREPRSGWSSVWPFLLVVVVCGAIAVGAVTFLSKEDPPATPPVAEESAGGAGGGDAAGEGSTDAPAEEPSDAASEEPDEEPSEEPSEEPTEDAEDIASLVAAADPTAYVRVLNDNGPAGEAARGSEALAAQGFSTVEAANFDGTSTPSANTVWYAAGREDTAAAVAAILGVPAEETSEQELADGDVIVVIEESLEVAE